MKLLTFDIGQKMTGWAVGEPDMKRPFWGHYAVPNWSADQDGHTIRFRNLVRTLIETHKPDKIGYEKPFINPESLDVAFTECQFSLISQLWVLNRDMNVGSDVFAVSPKVWMKATTGYSEPPAHLGKKKGPRREWWKDKVMQLCRDRNWLVVHQDEADALGIMLYGLTMTDRTFASRQGPLFRRAEMQADRERMVTK
jgi:hypothetical protein